MGMLALLSTNHLPVVLLATLSVFAMQGKQGYVRYPDCVHTFGVWHMKPIGHLKAPNLKMGDKSRLLLHDVQARTVPEAKYSL